jgi:hypothetical protein
MMADELLVRKGQGNVDVQPGGAGNPWYYLSSCASMSGPEVGFGDFERKFCQDPKVAGAFRQSSMIQGAPDLISFDLMTKLGKLNYLKRLNCPFSQRARYAICGEREDTTNYDPLILSYCDVRLQSKSYDDLVVTSAEDDDEILVTSSAVANNEYEVRHISPGRIGGTTTTMGDQLINDIEYCDSPKCAGYCGVESDGCTTLFAVTNADAAPYAAPNLIKLVKNLASGAITATVTPILGLNGNAENVECSGKRIGVTSNSDSAFAYNDSTTQDQNEWNKVVLTRAPSTNHNALFKRTSSEWWIGCVGGYVLKSGDGGITWNEAHSATLTTETINAVFAYDKDLIVAAGNNGAMIMSSDGGQTWSDITETSTTSANILDIVIPPNRSREIYIGTNNGRIYRSVDQGLNFTRVAFDGDSVGTVDDIDFCGPCSGEAMFILHNDAGPRARILRDLSGGAGGNDVEIIMDYTQTIQSGIDLNALACCDVNEVVAAGALFGGYPVIIKAGLN